MLYTYHTRILEIISNDIYEIRRIVPVFFDSCERSYNEQLFIYVVNSTLSQSEAYSKSYPEAKCFPFLFNICNGTEFHNQEQMLTSPYYGQLRTNLTWTSSVIIIWTSNYIVPSPTRRKMYIITNIETLAVDQELVISACCI